MFDRDKYLLHSLQSYESIKKNKASESKIQFSHFTKDCDFYLESHLLVHCCRGRAWKELFVLAEKGKRIKTHMLVRQRVITATWLLFRSDSDPLQANTREAAVQRNSQLPVKTKLHLGRSSVRLKCFST